MKAFLRLVIALIVLAAIAYGIGYAIPAHQVHVRRMTLQQAPGAIFALLTDLPGMPKWSRNLEEVESLPPIDGHEATRQSFKGNMHMIVVTTESKPPSYLVRTVKDEGDVFTGSWTYEITPAAAGSEIVLTEQADTRSAIFRLLSKIFGPTKYMDAHLEDIAKHFGETAGIR